MWMTSYIDAIKRQLIDQYGFPENPDHAGTILGDVPDGDYPMVIEDKAIIVTIKDGMINFSDAKSPPSTLRSVEYE